MSILVQKFGGTSVGTIERIKRVAEIIAAERDTGKSVVIVVSAMSGTTDGLVALAQALLATDKPSVSLREMDAVLGSGEVVSAGLLAMALQAIGVKARSYQAWQIPITTNDVHGDAAVVNIDTSKLLAALEDAVVPVVCGFQGIYNGSITTLGRGGSDTTAVALSAYLGAEVCDIFSDVDGVYSIDPHKFLNARKIARVSYDEMLDMALAGAKVMHHKAIEMGRERGVKIRVRSTFAYPSDGTIIDIGEASTRAVTILTSHSSACITLTGGDMISSKGFMEKVLEIAKHKGIKVMKASTTDLSMRIVVAEGGHEFAQVIHDSLVV